MATKLVMTSIMVSGRRVTIFTRGEVGEDGKVRVDPAIEQIALHKAMGIGMYERGYAYAGIRAGI